MDGLSKQRNRKPALILSLLMGSSNSWVEHRLLPGYLLNRSSLRVSPLGLKHGCPEPALGHNEAGELSYWVKPIGYPVMIRIRIEGLKDLAAFPATQ